MSCQAWILQPPLPFKLLKLGFGISVGLCIQKTDRVDHPRCFEPEALDAIYRLVTGVGAWELLSQHLTLFH